MSQETLSMIDNLIGVPMCVISKSLQTAQICHSLTFVILYINIIPIYIFPPCQMTVSLGKALHPTCLGGMSLTLYLL